MRIISRAALISIAIGVSACLGPSEEKYASMDEAPTDSNLLNELAEPLCDDCPELDDTDGDGHADVLDNCPWNRNPDQLDCDGDGVGLACDWFEGEDLFTYDPYCPNCDLLPPAWKPRSSPNVFYAVGSGTTDGSSDVYEFRYCNWGIRRFRKIGEAGTYLRDIAFDSYTGTLYGIDSQGYLRGVSKANGSTTIIGYTGVGINALTFTNEGLIGWSQNSGNLLKISTPTGSPTTIGYVGYHAAGDLAGAFSGKYYGTAQTGSTDALVKIANNSQGTLIGLTGHDETYGVAIDQQQVIFMARASASTLYLYYLNPQTGASTLLATYPTTVGLFGLATYAIAW